jgi:uncharacterized protein (TIGR03067 family)
MNSRIGLVGCVLLGGVLLAAASENKDKAADKLQGTWTVVSVVIDGKENPKAKDDKVTFDGAKLIVKHKDDAHEATYKLDPAQKPKAIDITPTDGPNKDKVMKGIYSIDGDDLKVCWTEDPDNDRPKEFESKEGSGLRFATLKRDKN